MDRLSALLKAIMEISDECTDPRTQHRLDDLYDRTAHTGPLCTGYACCGGTGICPKGGFACCKGGE